MIFVRRRLRRRVALALLRDDMEEDGPRLRVAYIAEHGEKVIEVMTVNRSDIIEAKLLEQRAAGPEAAREFFGLRRLLLKELRQSMSELLADIAERPVGTPGNQPCEISRHRTDRWRDRHVIIVENDDEPLVARAGVVHRFIGHAGRHRTVADHAYHAVAFAGEVPRHRHAEARRDRRR